MASAIYVVRYGNLNPEYADFAVGIEKQIYEKLHQRNNESSLNTYYLEEEVLLHGLFPREMIVPSRKKTKYRINKGEGILNFIGYPSDYIDVHTRNKIKKLSVLSLIKAYEYTKNFSGNYFRNLTNFLIIELEI